MDTETHPPTTVAEQITTAEKLDALPIRERDAWVAAVLRFMRERGYTVTAPGQEPDAPAGATVTRADGVCAEAIVESVLAYCDLDFANPAGVQVLIRIMRTAVPDLTVADEPVYGVSPGAFMPVTDTPAGTPT